jgi:hypothetical protein
MTLTQFYWMLVFYAPPLAVVFWLLRKRKHYDAAANEPFTEQPLRLAGESSAERAQELFDDASTELVVLLFACPVAGLLFSNLPGRGRLAICLAALGLACVAAFVIGRRMRTKLSDSWCYRLGAKGERVVGRELDRLMAHGYVVFHDVPFNGWNIDHVVVGPRGVFAVETKTWRKPTEISAEIVLDGDALITAGGHREMSAHQQATANAESLGKWIGKAAAEQVTVVPVVALPGWRLVIKRYGEVAVYSATNMSEHLPKRGRSQLTPEQIKRIAFPLSNLCSAVPISP